VQLRHLKKIDIRLASEKFRAMPTLEEIKKRAKNPGKEPPLAVDDKGNVNTEGKGTKVPTGTFHFPNGTFH
jgi:hypothetical protein